MTLLALTLALSLPDWLAYVGLGFALGAAVTAPIAHPVSRHYLHCRARAWFASATDPNVFSWTDAGKFVIETVAGSSGTYTVLQGLGEHIHEIVPNTGAASVCMAALGAAALYIRRFKSGPAPAPAATKDAAP